MTAAGWYPDPAGSTDLRWWDGTQWTAHTTTPQPPAPPRAETAGARERVLTPDVEMSARDAWRALTRPVQPQPAPAPAPRVLLDVEIQGQPVWNTKRLLIDTERVVFGDEAMLVRDIESVAYQSTVTKMYGAVATAESFSFIVTGGNTSLKVRSYVDAVFRRRATHERRDVFAQLISISREIIEPPIVGRVLDRVRHGASVNVGTLTIERSGITGKTMMGGSKKFSWAEVWGCRVERGQVFVDVRKGGKQSTPFAISMMKPNAPLLPALLEAGGTRLTG